MNEELEKLQSVGAQKIYETTHIPITHIQSILHGSFEGFSKVQFVGFISILEREYQQDLSILKKAGLSYFAEKKKESINKGLFVVPEKKKQNTTLYLLLSLTIFIGILILKFGIFVDTTTDVDIVDDTFIESVKQNIKPLTVISDDNSSTNESNESNVTDINTTIIIEEIAEPEEIVKSFKITSKSKGRFFSASKSRPGSS